MMPWPEVEIAKKDSRHEIILSGNEINERLNKEGLDPNIFDLQNLNYLNIHDTNLDNLPDDVGKLQNLQNLVLHSNKIERISIKMGMLSKLKMLDLSRNNLEYVPEEVFQLGQLTIVNLSHNQLKDLPTLAKNCKLSVLNLSNNKLTEFPDVFESKANLSELFLNHNEIEVIPNTIGTLSALKVLHVSGNKIKLIPGELYDCNKLKEIDLKENPITDKRLMKLIIQCRTKQVLDYVKQHCPRDENIVQTNKATKGQKITANEHGNLKQNDSKSIYKIVVRHFSDDSLKIVIKDDVKDIRSHIVACLFLHLNFTEEVFKKFIQLQTKLHDTVCEKRNAATIATHDFKKLTSSELVYTALAPNELVIKPLNRTGTLTGAELFNKLRAEAENLRKEKKRNTYSGIHKYLYLLEGKSKYPCLINSIQEVISFPPITNSETTKISLDTQALLLEVTSAVSQSICKKVADTLIKDCVRLFGGKMLIQQVKTVDVDGNLKAVYPSRSDLVYEDCPDVAVERE